MRIEEINGDEVIYMRRTGQYGEENYELMCKMKACANERGLLTDDAVLFGKIVAKGFCEMCVPIV